MPVAVDVPQLAPALGDRWRDLDVQAAGAAWLSILLGLRIDQSRASDVVNGWQGGIYRAWTDGRDVAVVLKTTWENGGEASRFATAMHDWVTAGDGHAVIEPADGTGVTVLFASSAGALSALRSAM